MTQIDFYILQTPEPREQFACRLAETIRRQGLRIYIHTGDREEAERMDTLLWSFRPGSFLPHALVGNTEDEAIVIGWGDFNQDGAPEKREVLLNLALEAPAFTEQFERVAEVVPDKKSAPDNILKALRRSYQFYEKQGYAAQEQPAANNASSPRMKHVRLLKQKKDYPQ